jgi:hypothetical protein
MENTDSRREDEKSNRLPFAAVTAVVAALIAALSSLGGVLLANHNSAQAAKQQFDREDARRQADLRREAYSDLVVASLDLYYTFSCYAGRLSSCTNTTGSTLTEEEIRRNVVPKFKVFAQKAARVSVLGTKDSVQAAFALSDSFPGLDPIPSKAHLKKDVEVIVEKFGLFLDTIRSELGLSPIAPP